MPITLILSISYNETYFLLLPLIKDFFLIEIGKTKNIKSSVLISNIYCVYNS